MMLWVVCYDVVDDRRRYRIMKTMTGYGDRVQYSVFECELTEKRRERLTLALRRLVNDQEDSVRMYPLNQIERERMVLIGNAKPREVGRSYFVDDEHAYPF